MKKFFVSLTLLLSYSFVFADGMLFPRPYPTMPSTRNFTVKYHRVSVEITDQIAKTHIDQVFKNENNRDLEAVYVFPLPEGANITEFATFLGDKKIEGKILGRDEARKLYEDIVRTQRDPALLEYIDRKTFKASVYPVPARGTKRMVIDYAQLLKLENNVCQYLYPLRIEGLSNQPLEEVTVIIRIKSKKPIKNVYSPTHNLSIHRRDDYNIDASYEATNVNPEKDLLIYYTISSDDVGINLLTYCDGQEDGYFLLLGAPKAHIEQREVIKKNVVFVFDRSGSMSGEKIEQAKGALRYCLNSLNPKDYFNIIAFSDVPEIFHKKLLRADSDNIKSALKFLDRFQAEGGTDINRALLLGEELFVSGTNLIVFLTDGLPTVGMTDINKIIENVNEVNKTDIRLFVFGVGYDVNTHFLDKLVQKNRGSSDYVRPTENIEVKVSNFFAKVQKPVLTNLKLEIKGVTFYDIFPKELPDLFSGSQLIILGRYKGRGKSKISLSGTIDSKERTYKKDKEFPKIETENEFIPLLWAARKIGYLLDEIQLHGRVEELVDEVVRLSKKFGIITEFTSFLVEEGRILADAETRERTIMHFRTSSAKKAGSWAVSQRQNAVAMQNQAQLPTNTYYDEAGNVRRITQIQNVNNRIFYNRKGVWVEDRFMEEQEVIKVQNFSEAYFQLVRANPKLGQFLALGDEVIIIINNQAVKVGEKGKAKFTKTELENIIGSR